MTLVTRITAVVQHIASILMGKEDKSNKVTDFGTIDDTMYPSTSAVVWLLDTRSRTLWVNFIRWDTVIPLGMHWLGRVAKDGRLYQYSIDAYNEAWEPMVWTLIIRVYKNGVMMWFAELVESDSVLDTEKISKDWSSDSITTWDVITYEVTTSTVKNAVLTLYYR